ncbi:HU family DNA-binding protein [bacterium]|nr:HU family DNA-binding protein [bacterium]
MGKTDLIERIAKNTGLEKTKVKAVLDDILVTITKTLKKGGKVQLTGFGNFSVAKRKRRSGVNPKTGEKIIIAARKVPKFTPGKALKDAIHPPKPK